MICLICSSSFLEIASWQKLFLIKTPEVICEKCKVKFERVKIQKDNKDWIGSIYEGALDSVQSIYSYNEWMKQVYQQYKFQLDVELAKVFITDFQQLLEIQELIVPIPLHPDMLLVRTFSQIEQLLSVAKVPFTEVLRKTVNGSQIGKSKKERMSTELFFSVTSDVQNKKIVLVDDLYTTGTTLHHAAFVLKKAGAQKVTAMTLIRA